jgi:UDP-N-acetylmuramyl-tripeptide synthetase
MIVIRDLVKALEEWGLLKGLVRDGELIALNNNDEIPDLEDASGKLSANTMNLQSGDIFVCIKGFSVDGHDLAPKALEKGISYLITERKLDLECNQIIVSDSRKANAIAAKVFYKDPTKGIKLIGITGTNGKTTVAFLSYQYLMQLGYKAGMIGTIGYYINGEKFESERTTPDILDLNEIFNKMRQAGVEYIVMEVSSHAISLDRVFGLKFYATAFTNLSQDHLDFHKDMKDYAETKAKLFSEYQDKSGFSIINVDDNFGREIYDRIQHRKTAISIDKIEKSRYNELYFADSIEFNTQNCSFKLNKVTGSLNREFEIKTQLIGYYNIQNLLTSIAIVDQVTGLDFNNYDHITSLKSAKGRIENVENNQNIGIYIDYAHTPDAVENVLKNLQLCKKKRIISVLGAGGNRDKSKRPLMARSALEHSDLVIITDDNPRDEKPYDIIRDIVTELVKDDNFIIIRDRKTAIRTAILLAKENDIVVIAGKGHEEYQEIKGVKHTFIETDIVKEALIERDKQTFNENEIILPIDILNFEKWFSFKIDNSLLEDSSPLRMIISDSRKLKDSCIFFAFKGERFDGAQFISSALGFKNVICFANKEVELEDCRIIKVDDSVKAYGFIASKVLMATGVPVIGLTGSTGKTTTKEFLFNIFSQEYSVLTNKGNENNLIGVPKTIFDIRPEHNMAILELGTNQFGEIESLARVVKPDLSIIVNIGPSHLEYLIDEDGVFREKSVLFNYTKKVVIYPSEDRHFAGFKFKDELKKISIGQNGTPDYLIHDLKVKDGCLSFWLNDMGYDLMDDISFKSYNASLAIIAGLEFGISREKIQRALKTRLNTEKRMEIRTISDRIVLIDCYNANPISMKYAIDYWHN